MVIDRSENPRRAVYTAVFGRYEAIVEQPIARDSDARFFCFTDDPTATSATWEIHVISERIQDDPTRSARQMKILGHNLLSEFDETLWIDNRVLLKERPEVLLDAWLKDHDMALPSHSYRSSVREEFRTVLRSGLDDPYKVREQLQTYEALASGVLEARPFWTAILARRQTPSVQLTMRTWMDNVLRFSKRDQLSVNYAVAKCKLKPLVLAVDNFESEWHRWINTSELPKNRAVRFWRNHGFQYPWWLRIADRVRSSRLVRGMTAKLGLGDRRLTRKSF